MFVASPGLLGAAGGGARRGANSSGGGGIEAFGAAVGWAVAQPTSIAKKKGPHVDEAFPFIITARAYLASRPGGHQEFNHSLSVILRTRQASGNMCAMPTKAKKATKKKTVTKAKKAPAKKKVIAKKVVKKGGAKKKAAPKAAMKSARAASMCGCRCC
jgi:hypothetical protein